MRRSERALLPALVLVASLLPGAGQAEVRRVEAVGAVPVRADAPAGGGLREAALRAGLAEAAERVARELLLAEGRIPPDAELDLVPILGPDPLEYAVRFRILEDYGERARVFLTDSDASTEYVVIVEAHVDEARVRAKLTEAGLLLPAETAAGPSHRVRVILEPLRSYRALAWTQEALTAEGGASTVTPLELEPGRAVLLVETRLPPEEIARRLLRAAPDGIRVIPRGAHRRTLVLQVIAETSEARSPARAVAGD